jgi:hypothetical protein
MTSTMLAAPGKVRSRPGANGDGLQPGRVRWPHRLTSQVQCGHRELSSRPRDHDGCRTVCGRASRGGRDGRSALTAAWYQRRPRVSGQAGPLQAREHLSNLNRAERSVGAGGCSRWRLAHLELVGGLPGCLFGIEANHGNPPIALRAEPVASPRPCLAGHRYSRCLDCLSRLVVRDYARIHFDEYRVHASPLVGRA